MFRRFYSTKTILTNRNPRNLEKLRIGYKPSGYGLEKAGRKFWHKLELNSGGSGRYVTATIRHHENGAVITASTNEWPIKKQLYRYNDVSAHINLARVLAQRCMEFGITVVYSNITPDKADGKVASFLQVLAGNGLQLTEPDQYKHPRPSDIFRPEKPWEVDID